MITAKAVQPTIELDGDSYRVCWGVAKILDILIKANGQPVPFERFAAIGYTKGSVQQYMARELNPLIREYGYNTVTERGEGVKLTSVMKKALP